MPQVGNKHFSYTASGVKAAKMYAFKIGSTIKYKKPTLAKAPKVRRKYV